jgi:uncharacterized membrane-anchored protein
VVGASVPLIALAVWLGLRRLHQLALRSVH